MASSKPSACCIFLVTILLLCLICHLASASTSLPCPAFTCGDALTGKFLDPERRGEVSEDWQVDGSGGVLRYYYFNADDFSDLYGWEPDTSNPSEECVQVCANVWNENEIKSPLSPWDGDTNMFYGWPKSYYYMYELTCEDNFGGTCKCMAEKACGGNPLGDWSDEGYEPAEYGWFSAPEMFIKTGKVCEPDIHGDPHFTGADGSNFDFSGIPNKTFAIISDAHVQVNGYFGGRYGQWGDSLKALTWIRSVSILWGHHSAVFSAREGPSAEYGNGYLASIVVDGEPIFVPPHTRTYATDGALAVEWVKVGVRDGDDLIDEYVVAVPGALTLRLTLRPEVAMLRTSEDGLVHFGISVDESHLSKHAHGILGQTFRPGFSSRLAQQHLVYSPSLKEVVPGDNAEGFIDGTVEDYLVKGMDKSDCNYCLFARGADVDEEMAAAITTVSVRSFTPRKLL